MESTALFEEKIPLTPRDLSKDTIDINSILMKKMVTKLEGRCSLHGWVKPGSLKIVSRSLGYVEKGRFTGDIVYHIQCEATVYNPPSGIVVQGDVIRKNKMGMYVNFEDAIRIILPRDLHIGDEAYDSINIGDRVSVEIKKSRYQVNDEFILSVGLFRGKEGSEYQRELNSTEMEAAIPEAEEVEEVEEAEAAVEEEEAVEEAVAEEAKPLSTIAEAPETQEGGSTGPIEFNSKTAQYRELSNFYGAPFTLDGKTWPSVEHYFQAMKFPSNPEYQEKIRTAKSGAAAKTLGASRANPIRQDWDTVRDDVMRKALNAKFEQNPTMKKVLLDTELRPLIEANPTDSYWGYGRNKKGKNKLGLLLMELRSRLSQGAEDATAEE